jgi:uncharacterized protein YebE (UPF0316 family)
MEYNMLWIALLIFAFRTVDVLVETVRWLLVVAGHKYYAAIIAFFEVTAWCWVFSMVVANQTNPICFLAYGAGYAVGQLIGCDLGHRLNAKLKPKGK